MVGAGITGAGVVVDATAGVVVGAGAIGWAVLVGGTQLAVPVGNDDVGFQTAVPVLGVTPEALAWIAGTEFGTELVTTLPAG